MNFQWGGGGGGKREERDGIEPAGPRTLYSKADTQRSKNQAAATAWGGIAEAEKAGIKKGRSLGTGTMAAYVAPKIGQAQAQISQASQQLPLMDALANQQYQLGIDKIRGNYDLGMMGTNMQLQQMQDAINNQRQNQLWGMIGGLF